MEATHFTIGRIRAAHARVKSGADFPAYIGELKQLGVRSYEQWVTDGHIDYLGAGNYQVTAPAAYAPLTIPEACDAAAFRAGLQAHQQGKSDYPAFCRMAAASGIGKWAVSTVQMTCTYYDKRGNTVLVEKIPD